MTVRVSRLPFDLDPLIAEAKRRMRRRRLFVVVVAVVGMGVGIGAAFAMHSPPGPGGPSPSPSAGAKPSDSSGPVSKLHQPPRSETPPPGYVSYPSEGVLLGPPPKTVTPSVSAADALRSFKGTGFSEFAGSSPPNVTLHTVTDHGKVFPAWVVTYRNTQPTYYGPAQGPGKPVCRFVGIYDLRAATWET